jgi:3-oxoacyl-[acyl-carrier protein] reductase
VNNAGIFPATVTDELSDHDLDAMPAVDVRATHVLVAEIAPAMSAHESGVIVNIDGGISATRPS